MKAQQIQKRNRQRVRRRVEERLKSQQIPYDFDALIERFKNDLINNSSNLTTYIDSLRPANNSFERFLESRGLQRHAVYTANLIVDDDMLRVDLGLQFFGDLNAEYENECKRCGVYPLNWKKQLKHLISFYSNKPNNQLPDLAFRRFDSYWQNWK